MILTKVRLAIAVAALSATGFVLWQVHDALAERRVRTAVDRLHVEQQRQEEERLRLARRHHAQVAALAAQNRKLKARIDDANDDPSCAWGADAVRLLNAARGYDSGAAGHVDGPLPAPAATARAGRSKRAD